jgi:hypothetical protein
MKTKSNTIKPIAMTLSAACLFGLNSLHSTVYAQVNASPPGVVKSVNGLAGQVSLSAGPGIAITPNGNGLTISSLPPPPTTPWNTTGNAGTTAGPNFLGTTDDQPLELKVNGRRAFRLEFVDAPNQSNIVNVVGGSPENFVLPGIYGATIAGGGGAANRIGSGNNGIQAVFGSIGGGQGNQIQPGADNSTIAGGSQNLIELNSIYSTIGGGNRNRIRSTDLDAGLASCTISGGSDNLINTNASGSFIGGGGNNSIHSFSGYSTLAGGAINEIGRHAEGSTISGGTLHWIHDNSVDSTISGGSGNQITGSSSTIGGGDNNIAGGVGATVPGGAMNVALGSFSFAAGLLAKANHTGAFVWSDSSGSELASTANNQFSVRASGGVRFFSDVSATVGVHLPPGGNSWAPASDRNLKENFQPANVREVLNRVAALRVQTYNLKSQSPTIRHIGPTAQDFQAAFGVGEDDKHIATVDADGVALAAIQGLDELLKEKDAKITALETRLEKLEQLLNNPDQRR